MKSRHISIVDYFNELQKEYFCAELRSKIYTKQNDKDYWNTIKKHKKNKIEDIALRNKLKSIFSDKSEYQKIFDEILCFGIPNFVYRDFYQKSKLESRDMYFYFQPGSDIKIKYENEIFIGKIVSYNIELNEVTVTIDSIDTECKTKINNVCRIV